MPRLKPLLRHALGASGLLPAVFNAYRSVREWSPRMALRNRQLRRERRALPLPPGDLVFSVAISRDLRWFLESGEATAGAIVDALAFIGRPLESFEAILDFGCGCGRVMRQWHGRELGALHGSDYNAAAIAWARRHLPHAIFAVNGLAPPLPYPDAHFDLVYALSVFTHLSDTLQHAWLRELRRTLRPNGILLLTTMGSAHRERMTEAERQASDAGRVVVRDASYAGKNICAAYHSEAALQRLATEHGFAMRLMRESGALGMVGQDLVVFEKR